MTTRYRLSKVEGRTERASSIHDRAIICREVERLTVAAAIELGFLTFLSRAHETIRDSSKHAMVPATAYVRVSVCYSRSLPGSLTNLTERSQLDRTAVLALARTEIRAGNATEKIAAGTSAKMACSKYRVKSWLRQAGSARGPNVASTAVQLGDITYAI